MQVDPINPKFKPPGTKRLKLNSDVLLSSCAFKFKLRRYNSDALAPPMTEDFALSHIGVVLRGGEASLIPCLFAHSVPVFPYTLAASSSLAWPLVPV